MNIRHDKISEYFGYICWNCGKECKGRGKNVKHEINGIRHRLTPDFYFNNISRFILLCSHCHEGFHILMKFNYSFEEILKIFRWKEINE